MHFTNIILPLTLLASAVLANPLEIRSDKKEDCQWECKQYYPKCKDNYKAKYCPKYGEDKYCKDYYDGCDKSKTYCCKYGKCWDD